MADKSKGFKIDDKVFGKVKGYPAWPARITSINGRRYGVVFYGTNETGTLKQDDVYYYLSCKNKFPMQKRKFYAEAITDIELDIQNAGGSDGNDNPNEENISEILPTATKGNKRKRSGAISVKNVNKRIKLEDQNHNLNNHVTENKVDHRDNNTQNSTSQSTLDKFITKLDINTNTEQINKSNEHIKQELLTEEMENKMEQNRTENIAKEEIGQIDNVDFEEQLMNYVIKNNSFDIKEEILHEAVSSGNDTKQEQTEVIKDKDTKLKTKIIISEKEIEENSYYTGELDLKNVNLIHDFYFTSILVYAERIQENSHYYKVNKPDSVSFDDINDKRLKVLPVKINANKYCGLIYAPKPLDTYRSEFQRAMDDANLVRELNELKAEINVGNLDINDPRLIKTLACDDEYVETATSMSLVAYKKAKVQWLQPEMEVFKLLIKVKKCLGMKETNLKEALAHLNEILMKMPQIEVVSLKKRSVIVEDIIRIGKYIGNPEKWPLNEDELLQFHEDAGKIRETADLILDKIRALFNYSDEPEMFLENFQRDCDVFDEATKNMREAEVFSLCAEPLSRKAQMELIFDEQANTRDDTCDENDITSETTSD